jgi:hypothetical protein
MKKALNTTRLCMVPKVLLVLASMEEFTNGKWIHEFVVKIGYGSNIVGANTLNEMIDCKP